MPLSAPAPQKPDGGPSPTEENARRGPGRNSVSAATRSPIEARPLASPSCQDAGANTSPNTSAASAASTIAMPAMRPLRGKYPVIAVLRSAVRHSADASYRQHGNHIARCM